ncbi:serine hydrolase [Loigolactobacillus jiayinensis]|uniref:Serine hydrolase n=1 Tax=Loigolactobacillus jiayinensis TaxID=2486016 RepID=A0ABW1RAL5_9LACO|nr:serine hydrolase [Loigolactobacillus jiayinensis]
MNHLEKALDELVSTSDGKISLMVQSSTGFKYAYQATDIFPAASLIKLGILLYAEMYWHKHPTCLSLELPIDRKVSGAGVLGLLNISRLSVHDLLGLMISISDNTATNTLIDYFGLNNIQQWLQLNYPRATLQRYMLDTTAKNDNLIDATTAFKMMVDIMEVPKNEFIKNAQNWLRHQQSQYKLPAFISDVSKSIQIYNKTGELSAYDHDVACFKKGSLIIYVTVLSHFNISRQTNLNRIQNIGKVVMANCTR